MEHDSKLRRLLIGSSLLVVYVVGYFFVHGYFRQDNLRGAEYKSAVASLPARVPASAAGAQLNRMIEILQSLERGGPQEMLGLGFDAQPLNDFLGQDLYDMQATLVLLREGQLAAAESKLELLATKVARAQSRSVRLLQTLSALGLILAGGLAVYVLYAGVSLRRHWQQEITVLSEPDGLPLIPTNFSELLEYVVREESSFTGHHAKLKISGADTSQLPSPLSMIVEQIVEQMVRNSVQHGGRPPDVRVMSGKPEFMTVHVAIKETDSDYIVAVRDDGEGIDCDEIVARAVELKLLDQAEADAMLLESAIKLIFHADFHSANKQLSLSETDQSLGELRLLIKSVGGFISIQNQLREYCQFTIRFPKDDIEVKTIG
ncbi:ATP-binding protein [Arenicella xantha]|uniref:Histidine kinase/DNA gyrase B/HSP90-like ATPase n=1 Tax=Arenicella xantha TaxID=644221 RepID=A0A395JL87_9GAMM|nr:ATP-binding protein [Arenicella xantha]RBP48486.1 histidine kinase/DNA gyrase B/HSP90-like ATPase [Arenicella xantha]